VVALFPRGVAPHSAMSLKSSTPGLLRAMNDCLYGSISQLIT